MTSQALSRYDAKWGRFALLALSLVVGTASQALAADEPDLIFKRSTVFKWVSPNDKLATGFPIRTSPGGTASKGLSGNETPATGAPKGSLSSDG